MPPTLGWHWAACSQFVVSETITREPMKSRAGSSSIVCAPGKLEEGLRSLGLCCPFLPRNPAQPRMASEGLRMFALMMRHRVRSRTVPARV